MRQSFFALFIFGLSLGLSGSADAGERSALGEVGQGFLLLPQEQTLVLSDRPSLLATPEEGRRPLHELRFLERLVEKMVQTFERLKLVGSYPISAGVGSGRGGTACLPTGASLLLCFGGDAVLTSRLSHIQAKLGLGAYLKQPVFNGAFTVVVGPEMRLSVGLEGASPQSISFLEGGIGISAF